MKKTLVVVLLAITLGSAQAADLPSRKAAVLTLPPPVFTWTGFYVGANAGAAISNDNSVQTVGLPLTGDPNANILGLLNFSTPGLASAVATSVTSRRTFGSRTSALLGVQAGYNFQFASSFVVGLEADIQGAIGAGQRVPFANTNTIGAANANILGGLINVIEPYLTNSAGLASKRLDYLGTVRGRLGYVVTPTLLAYVTGGLAYGGVRSSTAFTTSIQPTGPLGAALGPVNVLGGQGGYSTARIGYTLGAGAEWMFMPNWSVKAEYLYYDLGAVTYSGGASLGNIPALAGVIATGLAAGTASFTNVVRTRVRYDGNIARVGVNYHFWSDAAAPVVTAY